MPLLRGGSEPQYSVPLLVLPGMVDETKQGKGRVKEDPPPTKTCSLIPQPPGGKDLIPATPNGQEIGDSATQSYRSYQNLQPTVTTGALGKGIRAKSSGVLPNGRGPFDTWGPFLS